MRSRRAIDLILAKYNTQQRTREQYRFEAEESRHLMQPDLVAIGHVNPGRWRHIADTYASLGMLPEHFPLDGFLYESDRPRFDPRLLAALGTALMVALLLAMLSWRVESLNRRLRIEIEQREVAHRKLAESEALHRLLTENSGDVIWMLDLNTRRFEYVSPVGATVAGVHAGGGDGAADGVRPNPTIGLQGHGDHRRRDRASARGRLQASYAITEIEQPHKDGGIVKTEVVTSYLMDDAGRPAKLLGVTRDISQRKALEAELRTRVAAIEAAGDAILITDIQGYLLYANPVFTQQTGYSLETDKGMHVRRLNSGTHAPELYARLWRTVLDGQVWRGELVNRRKNGELYEEEMTISPVKNERGEIECFVAVQRDVSEKRTMERALQSANERLQENLEKIGRLQDELAEQAIRDPLTGLYNRRYLDETLPREFARARHEGYALVAAMVDVDHFKRINDSWGHPAGDVVLKALASLLREHFREGDIVCRYGGEEFLLLLPHISLDIGLERVELLRTQLADEPPRYGDIRIEARVSIGLASFPDHAQTPEALIEQADAALYRAKRAGRNRTELALQVPRSDTGSPAATGIPRS